MWVKIPLKLMIEIHIKEISQECMVFNPTILKPIAKQRDVPKIESYQSSTLDRCMILEPYITPSYGNSESSQNLTKVPRVCLSMYIYVCVTESRE